MYRLGPLFSLILVGCGHNDHHRDSLPISIRPQSPPSREKTLDEAKNEIDELLIQMRNLAYIPPNSAIIKWETMGNKKNNLCVVLCGEFESLVVPLVESLKTHIDQNLEYPLLEMALFIRAIDLMDQLGPGHPHISFDSGKGVLRLFIERIKSLLNENSMKRNIDKMYESLLEGVGRQILKQVFDVYSSLAMLTVIETNKEALSRAIFRIDELERLVDDASMNNVRKTGIMDSIRFKIEEHIVYILAGLPFNSQSYYNRMPIPFIPTGGVLAMDPFSSV